MPYIDFGQTTVTPAGSNSRQRAAIATSSASPESLSPTRDRAPAALARPSGPTAPQPDRRTPRRSEAAAAARRTAAGEIVIAAAARGRLLSPRAGPLRAARRGCPPATTARRRRRIARAPRIDDAASRRTTWSMSGCGAEGSGMGSRSIRGGNDGACYGCNVESQSPHGPGWRPIFVFASR